MIYGIGVDTASVQRVAAKLAKESFAAGVYSPQERALLATHGEKHAAETAAGNFAAKEAFLKAVGTGVGGFALPELSALRHPGGAPYFALTGKAAQFCRDKGITAHLSITHEGGFATAFVVLEQTGARLEYL